MGVRPLRGNRDELVVAGGADGMAFVPASYINEFIQASRAGGRKLLDRAGSSVVDVPVPGSVPLDVDTWEDYERVLPAGSGAA